MQQVCKYRSLVNSNNSVTGRNLEYEIKTLSIRQHYQTRRHSLYPIHNIRKVKRGLLARSRSTGVKWTRTSSKYEDKFQGGFSEFFY